MSNVASPFGLKPAFHPSGTIRQAVQTIASGYNADIFQFGPVIVAADGTLTNPALLGDAIVGVFNGVEWTGQDGRRRVGNRWPALTAATEIVAYYTPLDPALVFEIQANASVAQTNIGELFDFTAVTFVQGNVVTGLSIASLDVASGPAGTVMRIVGVNPAPDNVIGDAFTIVQVQLAPWLFEN